MVDGLVFTLPLVQLKVAISQVEHLFGYRRKFFAEFFLRVMEISSVSAPILPASMHKSVSMKKQSITLTSQTNCYSYEQRDNDNQDNEGSAPLL